MTATILANEPSLIEQTQSSTKCFQDCKQKYVFRYVLGLQPSGANINLITGEAIHRGLESLISFPNNDPQTNLVNMRQKVSDYLDTLENNPFMLEQMDKLTVAKAQVFSLLEAWPAYYANFFEEWEVIDTEVTIRAVEGANLKSHRPHRMAGKIDAIVKRKCDSTIWIMENKSKRYLTGFNWSGNLELDHQVMWYALIGIRTGHPISGCLYNAIGKPQHRLSKTGYADLKFRMSNAIAAEPEKYFAMVPIDIDNYKLHRMEMHFSAIMDNVDAMHDTNKHLRPTMSTGRCGDFGGCPYAPLCQAGADVNYPAAVMEMPEVNLFEICKPHGELE